MQGGDHLWLNEGWSIFATRTAQYFPKTAWGSMGVRCSTSMGDGRLDLFVTACNPAMWVNILPVTGRPRVEG